VVVTLLNLWRATPSFREGAVFANVLLLAGGVALTVNQVSGYLAS